MSLARICGFGATILGLAAVTSAQQPQEAPKPIIKNAPIRVTSPASGVEMYTAYCAVCHGRDGRGAGPAAAALKTPPSDLTTLAKRDSSGAFPALRVQSVVRGDVDIVAHGTRDMPIWGVLFWQISEGHQSEVQVRLSNLNKYLQSLQVK